MRRQLDPCVYPETFFEVRDLDVPNEMKVGIRAEIDWSEPAEPHVIRRGKVETKITSRTTTDD